MIVFTKDHPVKEKRKQETAKRPGKKQKVW